VISDISTSSADLNLSYARTISAVARAEPSVPLMKLVESGTEPQKNSVPSQPLFVRAAAAVASTPQAIYVLVCDVI
jgi:hypothetical protein